MQAEQIISITKNWINDVVIGCNFCPFAAREVSRHSIHYVVADTTDNAELLLMLSEECGRLDNDAAIETTFLIFSNACPLFQPYLLLLSLAEKLLKQQQYEGVYQIASFHPEYRFSKAPANDAANYTNRSPYPMMQLLREESVEKALAHYPSQGASIPDRNIAFARGKGLAYMKMLKDNSSKPK